MGALLPHILRSALSPHPSPDIRHLAADHQSLKGLFRSFGFGKEKAVARPSDFATLAYVVVGGVTLSELRDMREIAAAAAPQTKVSSSPAPSLCVARLDPWREDYQRSRAHGCIGAVWCVGDRGGHRNCDGRDPVQTFCVRIKHESRAHVPACTEIHSIPTEQSSKRSCTNPRPALEQH